MLLNFLKDGKDRGMGLKMRLLWTVVEKRQRRWGLCVTGAKSAVVPAVRSTPRSLHFIPFAVGYLLPSGSP